MIAGREIVVIVGPTASGKTAAGIAVAKTIGGEIISADSRQVYRSLTIGTAKPTDAEREGIPHHFIDILDPDEEYNAGLFGEQARGVIDEVFLRRNVPIVVGGSGLYVRSLIDGLFDGPGADPEFRHAMELRLRRGELPMLLEELRQIDPVTAGTIDPTKPRRIVRALEVFHTTGRPLSSVQKEGRPEIRFRARQFGIRWDRAELYRRIDARVESMMTRGLVEEVVELQSRGFSLALNALNTVGYAEVFAMLAGEISKEAMVRLIQQNTRRYAKRQLTWFTADARITWVPAHDADPAGLIVAGLSRELFSSMPPRST